MLHLQINYCQLIKAFYTFFIVDSKQQQTSSSYLLSMDAW